MMRKNFLAVCSASLLLSACATTQLYDGPKRAESEVVIVKGMSNVDISAGGYASKVCAFDRKEFDSCQPFIEFLPGEHTLTLRTSYMDLPGKARTITRNFEPGEQCLLGIAIESGVRMPAPMGCKVSRGK